jgi:hypothetical protein
MGMPNFPFPNNQGAIMTQSKQTTKRKGVSKEAGRFAHYQQLGHVTILGVLLSNIMPRIQNSKKSHGC